MIGGTDIVIESPPEAPVVELILRRLRRAWPQAVVRGASATAPLALDDALARDAMSRDDEFFVYRDGSSHDAWQGEGATHAENTMLHFLVAAAVDPAAPREVTLVCDRRTEEIDRLVEDLTRSFRAASPAGTTRAASPHGHPHAP